MPTIKQEIKLCGRGIHSGKPVTITICPSESDGIFFRRVDIKDCAPIRAEYSNVGDTSMRNTTVGAKNGPHVQTVEHLMAALFILGVNRAIINIDGPETPILDGSADKFISAICAAGVTGGKMKKIIVRRPVIANWRDVARTLPKMMRMKIWFLNLLAGRKNDGFVKLDVTDNDALHIRATLSYPEKIIGTQTFEYTFDGTKKSKDDFIHNIARARTFGKYSEWEYLKAHGMGRGADETNVIALNDAGDGTLNNLIWPDEFVRHKIIDAVGDMAQSGGIIIGNLTSYKGSHAMNNIVLKKLFSDARNYDIVE